VSKDPLTPFPLNGIDLATVSNEQLVLLGQSAPVLYHLLGTTIVRLSVNLILKFGSEIQMQEIEAMKCALSRTSVPTPKLHRYFFTHDKSRLLEKWGYIVSDYVEGNTLSDISNDLGPEQLQDIFGQIADIVSQLQAVHFDQPGPLGGGRCRGFWFSMYEAGPFHNKEQFNAWFTRNLEAGKRFGQARKDLPPFNYDSFVLVHQDLQPDNLILDPDGKVWIIDWGNAGAYPAIFESASIRMSLALLSTCKEFNDLLLPLIYDDAAERDHLEGAIWGILTGLIHRQG
jgi:serine/threonine protein kinase